MIDATIANFEDEVIAASHTVPVLVDFWAPWCAPCRTLGPILEKLEAAYAGRFKLVKIDSDAEQQIAAAFGVRSIPTCVLLMGGQPVDGFMGAKPESAVRAFLDKHVPDAEVLEAEMEEDEALAHDALADGDVDAALARLEQAVATDPANDDARFGYVKLLLQLGAVDEARAAFAPVADKLAAAGAANAPTGMGAALRRLEALGHWFDAIEATLDAAVAAEPEGGSIDAVLALLDARIAANKRDFDARFARAQVLMAAQRWTDAMDELLEILMRDKVWADGRARRALVAVLEIIEPPKPKVADGQIPPQDPTVASYRRRLSSVVLS